MKKKHEAYIIIRKSDGATMTLYSKDKSMNNLFKAIKKKASK